MTHFLQIFGIPLGILFLVYILVVAYKTINKALKDAVDYNVPNNINEVTPNDISEEPEYITIKKSELIEFLEIYKAYNEMISSVLARSQHKTRQLDSIINVEKYSNLRRPPTAHPGTSLTKTAYINTGKDLVITNN